MDIDDHAEDYAEELGGNFDKFPSFGLDSEYRDAMVPVKDWCIVYTSNRDSGLLDQSNEAAILKAMKPYMGWIADPQEPADCEECHHGHWAVGHVDGLYLRVRKNGEITPAFREYVGLLLAMADYPVLDESDYSARQWDDTLASVTQETRCVFNKFESTPKGDDASFDDMGDAVAKWLDENEPDELEPERYPSSGSVERALVALGYIQEEEDEDGIAEHA